MWSDWLKCSATALFLACRTSARCSLSRSATLTARSVSPTYTTRSHLSHFMPYTALHVSQPLWLLILISGCCDPFMMLSVKIRGQIWHFGEQKVSAFPSLVLNTLLCLPCTKISPRFLSFLNATIGGSLKIVFIRSDLSRGIISTIERRGIERILKIKRKWAMHFLKYLLSFLLKYFMITSIRYLGLFEHEIQINILAVYYCSTVKTNKPTPTHHTIEDKFQIYWHLCVYIDVFLKHMNNMFSTSEVYFHRQNTLNLTNTNLGRRGKNNNPFQRDSYLQNINTI